jgi:lipid-binding SYLF domain-containing protein
MNHPLRIQAFVLTFLVAVTALASLRVAQAQPALSLDGDANRALNALYERSADAKALGVMAGLEVSIQSFDYAMFFMSDAAREDMQRSSGFTIGTDPNIVLIDAGVGKEISTSNVQADVYGYVFKQKGLMGGIALQGVKITRLER